ncbi:MAG TPA: hypothetical protein VMA36_11980 [Candidatus Limnocylindria bacterium]|jgi:hypothetical protein|nr:hypothetical protein [Candidatus Limnocylindria bacterium]
MQDSATPTPGITEAETCRWLGARVSLIGESGVAHSTGLLRHVTSKQAFILEDRRPHAPVGMVRAIPLALIVRVVPAL